MALEQEIREQGRVLGFHRIGIARAESLNTEFSAYEAFIDAGFQGEMEWLAEHREARRAVDTPSVLDGARSVVVCALSYHRGESEPSGPRGARIARYARGRDYHVFFRRRLRALARWLRARVPGSKARPIVDTAPVLERAWAQRAGVGFVGKNGCVIAPGLGSYVVLGEVVTDVELVADSPLESRCGSCTRCLDACPTQAFAAPFVLDPRSCVSYLTIESRTAIPVALRTGVGDWLFGCDVCQDVCPYNRTAAPPAETTKHFAVRADWLSRDVSDVARWDDTQFREATRGSPVSRAGRAGMVRNALVVIGNSREAKHLPMLRELADRDVDATIRETARWAIERIEGRPPRAEETGSELGRRADPAIPAC